MAQYTLNGDWRRNSRGETYGSSALAGVVGYTPDLIAVVSLEGESGYVRYTDLYRDTPQTIDEVEAYEARYKLLPEAIVIPVYDREGSTVIGSFEQGNPYAGQWTPEEVRQAAQTLLDHGVSAQEVDRLVEAYDAYAHQ